VCVGEILFIHWFSKELKNNLSKNNWLCGVIRILLIRKSIFVRWGFSFLIVLVPRYKLSLCHAPIKPDLLGFPRIDVFVCGLLDHVFKRFTPFWYQSFAPLIWLYPFISYIFVFTFHVNFSLCCFCLGSDLVSNQFRSDCLLPTLFLISCEPLKHAVKQPTRKDTKLY
jgi:hypothetical protein